MTREGVSKLESLELKAKLGCGVIPFNFFQNSSSDNGSGVNSLMANWCCFLARKENFRLVVEV